VGTTGRFLPVG